jgi:hypothetical protein
MRPVAHNQGRKFVMEWRGMKMDIRIFEKFQISKDP